MGFLQYFQPQYNRLTSDLFSFSTTISLTTLHFHLYFSFSTHINRLVSLLDFACLSTIYIATFHFQFCCL
ncbi:hypothetical protein CW304_06310 [Bacillus sp. UFRGS-B20]|nr:hypothetical protein CW304_06310 [Bacillus sp. UFRGS-B20]